MSGHRAHMWICGAMVLVAVGVLAITGRAFTLLPIIGCVLMLLVMMQMMRGMGGRGGDQ